MNSFLLLAFLVLFLASLMFTLTSGHTDNFSGPIMGLLSILAVVLAVGVTERSRGNRGEKP